MGEAARLNDLRWLLLHARKMAVHTAGVAALCRSASIQSIFIKGWSVSRFYPKGFPRYYSDVDVAVNADDYGKAHEALLSSGYPVDLHREFRHLDTVSWNTLFSRSKIVSVEGVPLRVLSHEDELRIVCTHWLNDGGVDRERLWDIYYLVKERPLGFDWDICLHSSGENRKGWVACAIQLTARYLSMNIESLPDEVRGFQVPKWVVRTVEREWKAGDRLASLLECIHDPRRLIQQVRKRIPPNPIQSTIELNGELKSRFIPVYQSRAFVRRARPSLQKLWLLLRNDDKQP